MDGTEIKRRLREIGRTQTELAEHLGVSIHSISRLVQGKRSIELNEARAIERFLEGGAEAARPPGKIPVFGFATGSNGDRVAFADERVLEWIDPPAYKGADAAVRVSGESMEPRFHAGELAFVRLNLPPARGQDVVAVLADGAAIVKTYVGSRDGRVWLRQHNPDRELSFAWDEVRALHTVVFRG